MEKKKLILLGVLGALILIFCFGLAMDTLVTTTDEGLNKAQLTTSDAGITHKISINCSSVRNRVKFYGMDFIPQGGIQEFYLEERAYTLYADQIGGFAAIVINSNGAISYDSFLEGGVLLGQGTSNLTVIGHPITINATEVDQRIGIGNPVTTASFLGWTEPGNTTTKSLVANGQYKYNLYTSYTGHFSSFEILPTGEVLYDNSQVGIIEGNCTNTVNLLGYSITFDASDVD